MNVVTETVHAPEFVPSEWARCHWISADGKTLCGAATGIRAEHSGSECAAAGHAPCDTCERLYREMWS